MCGHKIKSLDVPNFCFYCSCFGKYMVNKFQHIEISLNLLLVITMPVNEVVMIIAMMPLFLRCQQDEVYFYAVALSWDLFKFKLLEQWLQLQFTHEPVSYSSCFSIVQMCQNR